MDAGFAFSTIVLLGLGAAGYGYFARVQYHAREREQRVLYYRRVFTDLKNAEQHFLRHRGTLADLLGMDEITARQVLEDAKFASRGLITYNPSDFHRITEEEAERMLALTTELKAADSTIEACQEAAMSGSNRLPALHEDLMRRVDRISGEAGALNSRFKSKTTDYFWSE